MMFLVEIGAGLADASQAMSAPYPRKRTSDAGLQCPLSARSGLRLVLGLQRASDPLPRSSHVFEHEAMFGEFGSRRHFTALSDF